MVTDADASDPPADLLPWDRPSPLVDALGGFLHDPDDPCRAGFLVEGPKVNARGLLHAGTVAAIADVVVGHAVARSTDPPTPLVTIQLSCDLLGSARDGDWVDVAVGSARLGRRLGSGTATMSAGGRQLARVSALFLPV